MYESQTAQNPTFKCFANFVSFQPAAVEELRKWTSTEAIGDITVTPDCITRVGYNSQNNSTINASHSVAGPSSADVTDDFAVISRVIEVSNDMPLDHRLPSPEEQCQIIALKYVI